jgi:hypothetical protein
MIRANRPLPASPGFLPAKKTKISIHWDPVHLTHIDFNPSTGEFTGLPKEWQQLLLDSGISSLEQERNPEAVREVMKYYEETQGAVAIGDLRDKINAEDTPSRPRPSASSLVAPSLSLDRSDFQHSPSSPSPQPEAPHSKFRRETPRAPSSATRRPGGQPAGVGQDIVQEHHAREWADTTALPNRPSVASSLIELIILESRMIFWRRISGTSV